MEENGTKLKIDVARLDPEGERFSGEVFCVDIDEPLVKAFGGVRYGLFARIAGRELPVKGSLEQDFDLVCSRCGRDFDDTVRVGDFVQSYEIDEKQPEVDLTEDVRECIILNLSAYPVCSEDCPGVDGGGPPPRDDRWDALDNLKGEEHGQS